MPTRASRSSWVERKPPTAPPHPTADYDELLVIGDGKDTFYLDGYGPISQKAAASVIAELRKL